MCGIAGIIDNSGIRNAELISMAQALRHRGPDDEGFALLNENGKIVNCRGTDSDTSLNVLPLITGNNFPGNIIGLAHRRLSILDLSSSAHQPMILNGKIIVHNGEVYNYKEIRDKLISKNYEFKSSSDTEVILTAYSEWGPNCVNEFVGMWAFIILDIENRLLFFSRDRFGIKPLYYFHSGDRLAFSSEIKALLKVNFVPNLLNERNLYQYLYFGRLSDTSTTLFNNIGEIPAGYNAVYNLSNNKFQLQKYYDIRSRIAIAKNYYDFSDPVTTYKNLLHNSIKLHLRSDVPVGSCLSGGLDSSTITAFTSKEISNNNFHTFTAAYSDNNIDESGFANSVNTHCNKTIPNFCYPDLSVFWNEFDKVIYHQDLPISSTSVFAQWEVMKLAGQCNMKVLLDGQGADEALGGYSFFTGVYLLDLLKKLKFYSFIRNYHLIKLNRSVDVKNEIARASYNYFPAFVQKELRKLNRIGPQFISKEFLSGFNEKSVPVNNGYTFLDRSIDSLIYGLHDLLRYEDRNSMAFSIESRVPFLDHRLVEYALSVDTDYKIKDGWTKYILRKSVAEMLPEDIVWRKDKKGFITPQQHWKQELNVELNKYLNETNIPRFLDRNKIIKINQTNKISGTILSEFWKTISIIKWYNNFLS